MTSILEVRAGETVTFPSVGRQNVDVFYDSYHRKVITQHSKGDGTVHFFVHSGSSSLQLQLTPTDKEMTTSVKLSPESTVMAIQKGIKSVIFINIVGGKTEGPSYSQSCKGKHSKIIGIEWTSQNEILFITSEGLELYQIQSERRVSRSIKTHNIGVNWFVYSHDTHVLVVSTGTLGNALFPFLIKQSSLNRLSKIEVELAANPQPPKLVLLERDVTIASLYGLTYILVLRHNPRPTNAGAEICLYLLNKDSTSNSARKSHSLRLGAADRFAIHIIDNLVVVHQQVAKASLVFDIAYPPPESSTSTLEVNVVLPLFNPAPLMLSEEGQTSNNPQLPTLYSEGWVIFQPSIVVDATVGQMLQVGLNLQTSEALFSSKVDYVDFLLRRSSTTKRIFDVLRSHFERKTIALDDVAKVFARFNAIYCERLAREGGSISDPTVYQIVVTQSDLYSYVLFPLCDNESIDKRYVAVVIEELLLSLHNSCIPVQPFVYEMLVSCLMKGRQFQKLHQLIAYRVIEDSKPLAFLLLSSETQHPSAFQVAMDMLFRLQTATDEIVEVLLSKNKILQALRYVQACGVVSNVNPLKFLESASNCADDHIFYTTFRYFEQRNLKLKGSPIFAKGDDFDRFLTKFVRMVAEKEGKQLESSKELIQVA